MISASKGYQFTCVTDPRCNLSTRLLMEALGSEVHVVTKPDAVGGFLCARLIYVRALCASDDRYVWLNQYTSPGNWKAHYRTTAPAIARQFPRLDILFVGAGTTGTLMGCARYFQKWHRPVRIIAVDSVGSVTFGGPPGRRMIPGLGASVRPPLLEPRSWPEITPRSCQMTIVADSSSITESKLKPTRAIGPANSPAVIATAASTTIQAMDTPARNQRPGRSLIRTGRRPSPRRCRQSQVLLFW
jgi:cysteine synthase